MLRFLEVSEFEPQSRYYVHFLFKMSPHTVTFFLFFTFSFTVFLLINTASDYQTLVHTNV